MKRYRIAILGASGAVGREMLKVLEEPPEGVLFVLTATSAAADAGPPLCSTGTKT